MCVLQVKEVIKKERHKSQQDTRKALNKLRSGTGLLLAGTPAEALLQGGTGKGQSAMFPPLNVKGANLHLLEPRQPSDLPLADIQKVSFNPWYYLPSSLHSARERCVLLDRIQGLFRQHNSLLHAHFERINFTQFVYSYFFCSAVDQGSIVGGQGAGAAGVIRENERRQRGLGQGSHAPDVPTDASRAPAGAHARACVPF